MAKFYKSKLLVGRIRAMKFMSLKKTGDSMTPFINFTRDIMPKTILRSYVPRVTAKIYK